MRTCSICGTVFDELRYQVVVDGHGYDSVECAMRARRALERQGAQVTDATAIWVRAARARLLGVRDADQTNVERGPADA